MRRGGLLEPGRWGDGGVEKEEIGGEIRRQREAGKNRGREGGRDTERGG